jgi:hypothetical protein
MINEAITTTAVKVAGMASIVTFLGTDPDITKVLIVGFFGGISYFAKEVTMKDFKDNKTGYIFNMIFSMMVAFSLSGIIFYAGRDGVNHYVLDIGEPVWVFIALLAVLNPNRTRSGIFSIFSNIVSYIENKINKK